jgi:hypothetical protein
MQSDFWGKLLENQLIVDETLTDYLLSHPTFSGVKDIDQLIPRLLRYNDSSCLSEFINIIK